MWPSTKLKCKLACQGHVPAVASVLFVFSDIVFNGAFPQSDRTERTGCVRADEGLEFN